MSDEDKSWNELRERLKALISSVRPILHPRAYEMVAHMENYGELVLSLEFLSDYVCEDRIVLPSAVFAEFMELMKAYGVDPHYAQGVPEPE